MKGYNLPDNVSPNDPDVPWNKEEKEEMEEDNCILVIGNLCDGFRFVGPFSSFQEASEYSERVDDSTWVATLEKPEED